MDATELVWLDATGQAGLVRSGQVSPLELVDASIARIEHLNPTLNAVIYERFDKARTEAASPSLPDGPFRGVPFLMKDIIQTVAGEPQSVGWKFLKDLNIPASQTSHVAQKFIDSGLVIVGQTTIPELGMNISGDTAAWGITRNPWNPDHVPGGSSTGAGAAVAAGMVSIAHGNDAGGSIRVPSSFCGVVGLKASRGRTSLGPDAGDVWDAGCEEGVLARSVRDVATAMDVISGNMPGDPFPAQSPERLYRDEIGRDPGRLRIGIVRTTSPEIKPLSEDAIDALDSTVALLTSLGHEVIESYPADVFDNHRLAAEFLKLVACHQAGGVAAVEEMTGRTCTESDFAPFVWALVQRGRAIPATDYIAHNEWRNSITRSIANWFAGGFDLILTPTNSRPAPRIEEIRYQPGETDKDLMIRFMDHIPHTMVSNFTGQPAINLPLHMSQSGLPMGISFVAPYNGEGLLLRLAAQIEQAQPWAHRRPPMGQAF